MALERERDAALSEIGRLSNILAERDDLIFTMRADLTKLGSQVKNVNIEAGGNTTTTRILSPGGPETDTPAAPSLNTLKPGVALAALGAVAWLLTRK